MINNFELKNIGKQYFNIEIGHTIFFFLLLNANIIIKNIIKSKNRKIKYISNTI